MDGFGFTGLMGKLGVERRLHTSGENKGFYDPFSPETPKMDAHAQALLDQVHAQFIKAVKDGRGKRLHGRRHVLGAVLDRREERRLGLADGYGTTDTVARDVLKAPDLVDYTVKESLTNRVAQVRCGRRRRRDEALTAGGASVSLR